MVTLKAKPQPQPQQQQQQQQQQWQEPHQLLSLKGDDKHGEELVEKATTDVYHEIDRNEQRQRETNHQQSDPVCTDDWQMVADGYPLEIENADNHETRQDSNRRKHVSLVNGSDTGTSSSSRFAQPRVWPDVSGSNSESTQCSDIEDDDNVVDVDYDDNETVEQLGMAATKGDAMDADDDDDDDDGEDDIDKSNGWVKRKVVTTKEVWNEAMGFETANYDDGEEAGDHQVLPNLDETTFGEVSITNSKHVHVGNTNLYKGPVTIKQFVYTNAYPIEDKKDVARSLNQTEIGNVNGLWDVQRVKSDASDNGPGLPLSSHEYDKVTKWLWTWRCAAILCVLALSAVTIVAVVSVLFTQRAGVLTETSTPLPSSPTSGIDPDDALLDSVRFIERDAWNAQPPAEKLSNLTEVPVPYVIISHTASNPCATQAECVYRVRTAQTLHIESFGWSDIGYNFLVGGDGLAYVGRGWDLEGAHAFGWNSRSIGISFIGTFNDVSPTNIQLHAARKVIELGVKHGKISPEYKLLGHRQVSATLSPGNKLYAILKTWPHWYPMPEFGTSGNGALGNTDQPRLYPILIVSFTLFRIIHFPLFWHLNLLF